MTRVVLFLSGAKTEEVALMNGLTVNLHLLMVRYNHFFPMSKIWIILLIINQHFSEESVLLQGTGGS